MAEELSEGPGEIVATEPGEYYIDRIKKDYHGNTPHIARVLVFPGYKAELFLGKAPNPFATIIYDFREQIIKIIHHNDIKADGQELIQNITKDKLPLNYPDRIHPIWLRIESVRLANIKILEQNIDPLFYAQIARPVLRGSAIFDKWKQVRVILSYEIVPGTNIQLIRKDDGITFATIINENMRGIKVIFKEKDNLQTTHHIWNYISGRYYIFKNIETEKYVFQNSIPKNIREYLIIDITKKNGQFIKVQSVNMPAIGIMKNNFDVTKSTTSIINK